MKFSKKIVIGILIYSFLFSQEILYVFLKTGGAEPTVLVGGFFTGVIAELWALARIEINRKDDEDAETEIEFP